jgi:16S rRNA (guanine527-N7)-methyltransferase
LTYIDLLLRWNTRINLTAIRDPDQIVTRHFGESLFAARALFPPPTGLANDRRPTTDDSPATRIADIGSGAGFPGLPLKLWAPHIALTLIESNHKKAAFLNEVARTLTLTNVNIQNARAESLPPQSFDLVTLRAVERFERILPAAANLVAPSGRLALLIGSNQRDQAESTLAALRWSKSIAIPNSASRILVIAYRQ